MKIEDQPRVGSVCVYLVIAFEEGSSKGNSKFVWLEKTNVIE